MKDSKLRLGRLVFVLFLAMLLAPLWPAQASAQPSLWEIQGAQGKVYLFGSAHVLSDGVEWRTPTLRRALAEAQSVVFEIDLDEASNPQLVAPMMQQLGLLEPDHTLQGMLRPRVWAALERTAGELNLPAAQLTHMRPWLAAVTLSVAFAVKQGFDPARGVDNLLHQEALAAGKSLEALESFESQMRIFADLNLRQQAQLLASGLRQMRETPRLLQEIVAAYGAGDQRELHRLFSMDDDELPFMRQRLLLDRHARWLPRIEAMLAEDRTRLIVVGAAHLAGPDSIVAMLRAKGVKVEGP